MSSSAQKVRKSQYQASNMERDFGVQKSNKANPIGPTTGS
jgi:hypothetical protein